MNCYRIKCILKKLWHGNGKVINGVRGVISLYLAILMVPFVMIAGSLINASRINSAAAIFDEALCNASGSTLGTYDKFLKSRFGLLAMQQDISGQRVNYTVENLISDTFKTYLEENLKTLDNTYTAVDSNAQGVYPLSDSNVLLTGIMEYSKYAVPVKLVEDGLNLDDLVKQLENMIPGKGILDLLTSGASTVNSLQKLGEDFELLKTAVSDMEIALDKYKSEYTNFSGKVSSYLSTQAAMRSDLAVLQGNIDSAFAVVASIITQIDSIKVKISDLEEDTEKNGIDHTDEIKTLQEELDKVEEDNKDALKEYNAAVKKYDDTKASYERKLGNLRTDVNNAKASYLSAIDALIKKLIKTEETLKSVQEDIIDVGTNLGGTIVNGVTASWKEERDKIDRQISELEKAKGKTQDQDAIKQYNEQIAALKEQKLEFSNPVKVAEAEEKGFEDAMKTMKTNIADADLTIYSTYVGQLRGLYSRVQLYLKDEKEQITVVSESEFYIQVPSGLLTYAKVEEAEKDLLKACTNSTIWGIINAIAGFIKALFSLSTVFAPELNAIIDSNYYSEENALPSSKDRSLYPLNYGDPKDVELSDSYKALYGNYAWEDGNVSSSFNFIETLGQIFTDLGIVTSKCSGIGMVTSLISFTNPFKEIVDAIGRIVNNLMRLLDFLANMFSASKLGQRVLLAGYANYMTSNRITYKGKALTGTSFNPRIQTSTTVDIPFIGEFQSLIKVIKEAPGGGSDLRFVGAEQEYIIFGQRSEILNQAATFAVIYVVRLILGIAPVITNPEVQAMASAATIASPIVIALIIFIEPLIETIILVNGGRTPFYQGTLVYLTPSGIGKMVEQFLHIGLDNAQLQKVKSKFEEEVNVHVTESNKSKAKGIGEVKYEHFMCILLMFVVPPDVMLSRIADIIQMEGKEYAQHSTVAGNGIFDLDKSYTFIRGEASFTVNEFISISEEGGVSPEKRIIYRGY